MIKNIKDPGTLTRDMDFKPLLNQPHISTPDISHIYQERIHTTPEPMACDSYGLVDFRDSNISKIRSAPLAVISNRKKEEVKMKKVGSK
jgi:hypothetical protein